jgi:SAM-dependent methyltransferase
VDRLTTAQLELIPWNTKYVAGAGVPREPPVNKIKELVKVPFMKRNREYPLFYSWVEVVRGVGEKPCRVLDSACGRGIVSQILLFKGHDVYACDIEKDFFCADSAVKFRPVDLNQKFPYPDDHFDVVINCEGLECLEGSAHFLREAKRVLRDQGRVILSIPNIQSLVGRFNFFKSGFLAGYDAALLDRRNILYLPFLYELLPALGYRITDIKGNVPQLTIKSKIFNAVFGDFFHGLGNPVARFSHSLIITAQLTKGARS